MALNGQQQDQINQSIALQHDFQNKANDYTNQYNTAKGQADQASGDISNFNNYMAGAGNAQNLYKNAFNSTAPQTGYNQDTLNQAQANVSQATGAQSAYNDFANTAASKWGMNAGALAASNANAQSGLNNNIAAASTTLGNQQKAFELAQNGANQQAGLGVQQQQTQLAGYKNAYDAAFSQQQAASENMKAYEKMAQDQGGLTASQWQSYEQANATAIQAQASMISANAAMKQANAVMAKTNYDMANQDYMKKMGLGDYATKAATPVAAPTTNSANPAGGGDWLDQIAKVSQNAGRSTAHWFGDVAHNAFGV
jgi:hypothetical protein